MVDQRYFTEELTLTQDFQIGVLVRVCLYACVTLFLSASQQLRSALGVEVAMAEVKLALTLGDNVEMFTLRKLSDDHGIGCHELGLHPRDDRPDNLFFGLNYEELGERVRLDMLFGKFHDG